MARQLSAYCLLVESIGITLIIMGYCLLPDQLYDGGGEGHPYQDEDGADQHVGCLVYNHKVNTNKLYH